MDNFFHAFILALLQGLTEFLPVSSSAHLILLPKLLGWSDQGLGFDIAVHLGTLCAVFVYFRKEIKMMTVDLCGTFQGKPQTPHSRMAWAIAFGTIPVGLAGILCKPIVETYLRSYWVIAFTTLLFGIALGMSSWVAKQQKKEGQLNWKDVAAIGCAQALALIPGTSRSGITLTAGLMMGLTREAAARYAFLLSIPVILLAGGLELFQLARIPQATHWPVLSFGFATAGISGYVCIHLFIQLLNRVGVYPFVIYRMALGCVLVFFLV